MKKIHFNSFVAIMVTASFAISCQPSDKSVEEIQVHPPTFFHNVYFYLDKELTEDQRKEFIGGLEAMAQIESLIDYHIVGPAMTPREVVDNTYDIAILTSFANSEGHDYYQVDSLHNEFRDGFSGMVDSIRIYDSVVK